MAALSSAKAFLSGLVTCKVLHMRRRGHREVPQWTKGNFQYNWIGVFTLLSSPLLLLVAFLLDVRLTPEMLLVVLCWSVFSGLCGNTAGYHRLYSHRSYTASPLLQYFCAFAGAGSFQGSIKWWARLHRIHHKYVDTDKDPYDARRGFWFSHWGWFCMRLDYDLLGDADVSDLNGDPVVLWQRKYFPVLSTLSGVILPWLSAGLLLQDWVGGFFYAVHLKMFLVHQFTFFINSLCHTNWLGATQKYNVENTPQDCFLFAFLAFGEGYHNFHHEFANDYRNGHKWYHLDPTKWYVYCCSRLGLCWDLVRTPDAVIQRTIRDTYAEELRREAKRLELKLQEKYPAVTDVMTMDDVQRLVKEEGRRLIIVEDYVLDLDKPIALEASFTHDANEIHWYDAHPGGRALLDAYIGRDATEAMSGGVYKHTHGARCTIPDLRIAHLKRKGKKEVAATA